MSDLFPEWKRLTLSQFLGKKKLEGIMRAICEELQEVYDIQRQFCSLTNIDAQEGVNLDNIGDIVCLSREDAQKILRKDKSFEMTDALYRNVLKYAIMMHGSNATYYDIMNSIGLIWNLDNVTYYEDRSRPATILLKLPLISLDDVDFSMDRVLSIRPAGVATYYISRYSEILDQSQLEKAYLSKLVLKSTVKFFPGLYLDGSWTLNGNNTLTGNVIPMNVEVSIGPVKNKIENTVSASVVLKKNLWYLDGARLLDGSKLLNAAIAKEDL